MRRDESTQHHVWQATLDENGLLPNREYWEQRQREFNEYLEQRQRESNARRARNEGQGELQQGDDEVEADELIMDGGDNNSGDNNEVEE